MNTIPKLKLNAKLLKIAYQFVDVEASAETAIPDQRIIEYAFVIEKLAKLPLGKVRDVGRTARLNFLPAALIALGWEVWGIDLREFKFKHPNFHLILGNIGKTDFPDNYFDAVYAVSTLEHIGLSGRYGVNKEDLHADAKTVKEIARILRPGGKLLCTVPYGREVKIIKSLQRIYDNKSLEKLFDNWKRNDISWYSRKTDGYWTSLSDKEATEVENPQGESALALLELIK